MPTESSMASSVEAPCSCQITDLSKDVSYEQFVDVNAFASRSMAMLQHEVCRNTLCMTQLNSLTNSSSTSVSTDSSTALAMLTCSKCSISSVIIASDNKGMGYSACYISAGVCRHTTAQLSCVLQQQLQHVDKVTLTAAAANLLCEAQPGEHRWQLDHLLQLMVYSNCTNPGSDTAAKPASAAPADADSSLQLQPDQVPQLAEHQHSHLKQQQQQGLHLRQCTAEADAALVVSWAAAFLQEVFHQPQPPTDKQVRPGVMPRLEKGWYYALVDPTSGCDVCLLAHTPSSTSSTRITMVYTPPEHRGRGHAAAAVRKLLELLQGSLGYDSICLFADKDKPHIGAMYKRAGFDYLDELHTLKRPVSAAAPAAALN